MTRPPVFVRPAEIDALGEALRECGSVRVTLDTLWPLWAAAAPRFVGELGQAEGLAVALAKLADRDVITLPVRAWDTSTTPPLPRRVAIPSARRAPRERRWARFPWRGEMRWVASLRDRARRPAIPR